MTWSSRWSAAVTFLVMGTVMVSAGCAFNRADAERRIQTDLRDYEASARSCSATSIQKIVFQNVANALRGLRGASELPILRTANAMVVRDSSSARIVIHWIQYGTRVTAIRLEDSATGDKYEIRVLPEDDKANAEAKKRGVVFAVSRKWAATDMPAILNSTNVSAALETDDGTTSNTHALVRMDYSDR
jgi:hypothetical protein